MQRDKQDPKFTGWATTDATAHMNCPRASCLVLAGMPCRTPKGRLVAKVHSERITALHEKYGTAFWTITN